MGLNLDFREISKRLLKYVVEGGMVALAAFYIPQKNLSIEDILLLALTAAATFALLDMYVPSIAGPTRTGVGFGIGANLVQFPSLQGLPGSF